MTQAYYTFKPLKSRTAKITENYIQYVFILCQRSVRFFYILSFYAKVYSSRIILRILALKKRGKLKVILTLKKKLYYFWAALKNYKKSSQKLKVFSGNKAIDSPPFDDKLSQKCFIGSPGSFDRILVLHETISSILLLVAKKVTVH